MNDLTKMLLLNKFKEFIELIRVSKIEISDNDSKFNNSKTSDNIKNDENFVTNYYEEADKEVSFKIKEAE